MMFASGWFVCAVLMTAMLVAAGSLIIALTAICMAIVFAVGYGNNFRREREAAQQFVTTFARRLGNAA